MNYVWQHEISLRSLPSHTFVLLRWYALPVLTWICEYFLNSWLIVILLLDERVRAPEVLERHWTPAAPPDIHFWRKFGNACGLTDADLADLILCLDNIGRDGIETLWDTVVLHPLVMCARLGQPTPRCLFHFVHSGLIASSSIVPIVLRYLSCPIFLLLLLLLLHKPASCQEAEQHT